MRLYNYINKKAKTHPSILHNLHAHRASSREKIAQCFYENSQKLSQRKGGNLLYHEIISLKTHENMSLEQQKKILLDLSQQYLSARAGKLLAFGKLHVEKGHLHVHLVLSANEIGSSKRYRLKKSCFKTIQQQMETYLHERYPELNEPSLYNKPAFRKDSLTDKEYQYKKRTGRQTKKDKLKELLSHIFKHSHTRDDLIQVFQQYHLGLYQRDQQIGVIYEGKKYRLRTLGLEEAYQKVIARIEQPEKPSPEPEKKEPPDQPASEPEQPAASIPRNEEKTHQNTEAKSSEAIPEDREQVKAKIDLEKERVDALKVHFNKRKEELERLRRRKDNPDKEWGFEI